ncbi:MAG: TolC family protein [Verrucomicrobia bacterium]|nr:TolC family protein [Verrucomicrobiota bacterium]
MSAFAAETNQSPYSIDLPTALRLAGAQNLDVALARERLAEARAQHESTRLQFFPWLSPGIIYRRHDGNTQSTEGDIVDVNKQSYAPGVTLAALWDLGEALYERLVAKQLAQAADHALEAQRQDATLSAAQAYFDLALAQASVGVAQEALNISSNYEAQVQHAVAAGIAFKGDLLRVQVQTERNRLALRQAAEQQRLAAARLAQTLHLDPIVELLARETDLAPISLVDPNATLAALVAQALGARPELKQGQALAAAARDARNGAVYGPWIPSVGVQVFGGGLGGGKHDDWGNFGDQQDYLLGLGWRIGPGGLFDKPRQRAAESRFNAAQLTLDKLRDEITRQVVDANTHHRSLADQLDYARQALATAQEGLRLAEARKEFAVGVVLETIQAQQDLTRTRLDYLQTVAALNVAQYATIKALGAPPSTSSPSSSPR